MRIIAGDAKGRTLKVSRSRHLRPTSGLVRGVIFDMLATLDVEPNRVLDLYAGTGSLGIEALSRGAPWVDFIDHDRKSCSVIKQNLQTLGFDNNAHVYCSTATKALDFLSEPYDLVLADPPYARAAPMDLISAIDRSSCISYGTTVVLETSRWSAALEKAMDLTLIKERRHGDTCIWIYRKEQST